MTEKRYFERMWEEEYYIFDSQIISEKDFDEKVEYEDYNAFADSMMGDEVVDRLNELYDENQKVQYKLRNCEEARKSYKQDWKACSSYCDEYKNEIISLKDEVEGLIEENKELKLDNDIKFWKHQFMMKYNTTQLIMYELAKAIEEGYEVSNEFQKYLDELKTRDSENREKMERLGI